MVFSSKFILFAWVFIFAALLWHCGPSFNEILEDELDYMQKQDTILYGSLTVSKDPADNAMYTTIQEAIDNIPLRGVITVLDNSVYDEAIVIDYKQISLFSTAKRNASEFPEIINTADGPLFSLQTNRFCLSGFKLSNNTVHPIIDVNLHSYNDTEGHTYFYYTIVKNIFYNSASTVIHVKRQQDSAEADFFINLMVMFNTFAEVTGKYLYVDVTVSEGQFTNFANVYGDRRVDPISFFDNFSSNFMMHEALNLYNTNTIESVYHDSGEIPTSPFQGGVYCMNIPDTGLEIPEIEHCGSKIYGTDINDFILPQSFTINEAVELYSDFPTLSEVKYEEGYGTEYGSELFNYQIKSHEKFETHFTCGWVYDHNRTYLLEYPAKGEYEQYCTVPGAIQPDIQTSN